MLSIYKASAGSGKTFTLAREYILMLLGAVDEEQSGLSADTPYRLARDGRRHRRILAITFTNKATEEMKTRIIHELAVLGGIEPGWKEKSPYTGYLTGRLGCTEEELGKKARQAMTDLLLDFDSFNVSTIDSFFQRVLRAFAREAEITGNYELQLDNTLIDTMACDRLLSSLKQRNEDNKGPQIRLVKWLTDLMLDMISQGKSFNIFNRTSSVFTGLVRFVGKMSDEVFMEPDNRRSIETYLGDPDRLNGFIGSIDNANRIASDRMTAVAAQVMAYGGFTEEVIDRHVFNLVEKISRGELPDLKSKSFPKLESGEIYKKKYKDTLDAGLPALCADLHSLTQHYSSQSKILNAVRKNAYQMGLLSGIMENAADILREQNTIKLSDTNDILSSIISDDSAPFVYERVGVMLSHFLIDEFQDTSRLQWKNLRPLVVNGLSAGDDSLIIGDEKQSIYRFRGSDPSLLTYKVSKAWSDTKIIGNDKGGNTNWRSTKRVVEFNNALFSSIARKLGFSDIYANVIQEIKKTDDRGYVEVISYKAGDDTDGSRLGHHYDEICRELDSGYAPSDIVILVRNNKEGREIMEYMRDRLEADDSRKGLRVVSDETGRLCDSSAVNMIIAMMRIMASAKADGHGRRRRLLGEIDNSYEHSLAESRSVSEALADAIESKRADIIAEVTRTGAVRDEEAGSGPATDSVVDSVIGNLAGMQCGNLLSMVEVLIDTMLSETVRREQNIYLAAFQDQVLEYMRRGNSDVWSFLKWWDTGGLKSNVSMPADENAIRVMTIHKSKGLEFKCVHLPEVNWPFFSAKSEEWFRMPGNIEGINPDLIPPMVPLKPASYMKDSMLDADYRRMKRESELDELNATYVAFTRAVDELIISTLQPSKAGDGSPSAGELVNEALDFKGDVSSYTVGEPCTPEAERQKPHTAIQPDGVEPMPQVYASRKSRELWNDTRLEPSERSGNREMRERGRLIHDVMAGIRNLDQLGRAIQRMVNARQLSAEEGEAWQNDIHDVIRTHGVETWFEGFDRVVCRAEIADAASKKRRADRVVWHSGRIDAIDYRSGQENRTLHEKGMRRFIREMSRANPQTEVRGFIWYIDTNKIVEVKSRRPRPARQS